MSGSTALSSASSAATSTTDSTAATSADQPADADGGQPDALVLQQGKLFRSLMSGPDSADRRPELLVRGGLLPARQEQEDDGDSPLGGGLGDGLHRGEVDVAAQLLAQRLLEVGTQLQATPAAAGAPDPTFAELMVKHIRRALVAADASDDSSGEIHLEMSDSVLPSTVLSLKRTEEGWQLHAVTTNPESRQALTRFAPSLVARFAESSLGQLRISLDGSQSA
jgi:Type III secretion protein (HpaP)